MKKGTNAAARISFGVVLAVSLSITAPAWAHHRADHAGGPQPISTPTDDPTTPPPSPEPSETPTTSPMVPTVPKPFLPPSGNDDPNCVGNALYAANPIKAGGLGPGLNPFAPATGALMLVYCAL